MKKEFYLIWLRIVCILTILTGLLSSLACCRQTQLPWLLLFDVLQWPLDGFPSDFSNISRALNAVLGGVMVGWACLILFLTYSFNENIRKALLYSVIIWFMVDSLGSYLAHIPGNIFLNIIFLLLLIVPLIKLKKLP